VASGKYGGESSYIVGCGEKLGKQNAVPDRRAPMSRRGMAEEGGEALWQPLRRRARPVVSPFAHEAVRWQNEFFSWHELLVRPK